MEELESSNGSGSHPGACSESSDSTDKQTLPTIDGAEMEFIQLTNQEGLTMFLSEAFHLFECEMAPAVKRLLKKVYGEEKTTTGARVRYHKLPIQS